MQSKSIPDYILDGVLFTREELARIQEDESRVFKRRQELKKKREYFVGNNMCRRKETHYQDKLNKAMQVYINECSYLPFLYIALIYFFSFLLTGLVSILLTIPICTTVFILHCKRFYKSQKKIAFGKHPKKHCFY